MAQMFMVKGKLSSASQTAREIFQKLNLTIAQEIPQEILEQKPPDDRYFMCAFDFIPEDLLEKGVVRIPTIPEVLFAVAFMDSRLAALVAAGPVRFMHKPFLVKECGCHQHEGLRQLIALSENNHLVLDTVSAQEQSRDIELVYTMEAQIVM